MDARFDGDLKDRHLPYFLEWQLHLNLYNYIQKIINVPVELSSQNFCQNSFVS